MRLAQALTQAGPADVLGLLVGGTDVGDAIVGHPMSMPDVHRVHRCGPAHRRGGGRRGIPAQAEMGGKNAAVVLDDADLDLAVDQGDGGAFRSTGQKCTATSRLIVTDGIADRFLAALTDQARPSAHGR